MKKSELNAAVLAYKRQTREALQTLYDNVNQGQRKQLIKKEEIKKLFDTYGVQC